MAEPAGFEGANVLLSGEKAGCNDLEIFTDNIQSISCWRLTLEELEEVNRTGVVWLSTFSTTPPPVMISGHALVTVQGRPAKAEPIIPKWKST